MRTLQAGFSILYIILCLGLLGFIGTTFAIVAISQSNRESNTSTSPDTTSDTTDSGTTPPPANMAVAPQPASNLSATGVTQTVEGGGSGSTTVAVTISNENLIITEWGMAAHTTEALGKVTYYLDSGNHTVKLNSDLQKRLPSSCVYAKDYGWGIQARSVSEITEAERQGMRLINGLYYAFLVPSKNCDEAKDQMTTLTANYLAIYNGLK